MVLSSAACTNGTVTPARTEAAASPPAARSASRRVTLVFCSLTTSTLQIIEFCWERGRQSLANEMHGPKSMALEQSGDCRMIRESGQFGRAGHEAQNAWVD